MEPSDAPSSVFLNLAVRATAFFLCCLRPEIARGLLEPFSAEIAVQPLLDLSDGGVGRLQVIEIELRRPGLRRA